MKTKIVAMLALLVATAASAAVHDHGVLESDQTSVAAGGEIAVRGKEFEEEESYTLRLIGALNEYDLGKIDADGEGHFHLDIAIPADVRPAEYQIVAIASDGDVAARLDVTVSAALPEAADEAAEHADEHDEMADMDDHGATAAEITIERDRSGIEWAVIGLVIGAAGGLGIGLGRRQRAT